MNLALAVHEAPGEAGLLPEGRRADVCHRGRTRLPGLLQVWPIPSLLHTGESKPKGLAPKLLISFEVTYTVLVVPFASRLLMC